jgi:hypothetical protein
MLWLPGAVRDADTWPMGSPIMTADMHEFAGRLGRRGVRLLVLASGMAFMVLVAGWTVVKILTLWRSGMGVRAGLLSLALLLVFAAWLRVMSVNWSAVRADQGESDAPVTPPDADEGTGIWGVGGPAMREPGNTGTWPRRVVDRRYEDGER